MKTYLVLSSAEDVSQALGRLFPDDPNLTAEELARWGVAGQPVLVVA